MTHLSSVELTLGQDEIVCEHWATVISLRIYFMILVVECIVILLTYFVLRNKFCWYLNDKLYFFSELSYFFHSEMIIIWKSWTCTILNQYNITSNSSSSNNSTVVTNTFNILNTCTHTADRLQNYLVKNWISNSLNYMPENLKWERHWVFCNLCLSGGHENQSLEISVYSPSGLKFYCCKFCGKREPSNCSLRLHERTHTGERPFACEFCGAAFAHKSNMRRHMKVHKDKRFSDDLKPVTSWSNFVFRSAS